MKIVMLLAAALLAAPPARAEEGKYAKLAHNVITSTAQVKPGEVVLISGGKHTTPLLEELAIETFKAGGLPVIFPSFNSNDWFFTTVSPQRSFGTTTLPLAEVSSGAIAIRPPGRLTT